MVIFWQDYCGKGNSRKFDWNTVGNKVQIENAHSYTVKKGLLSVYVDAMLAVTVVVPCLSGHTRAPGSSGSGVVAGAPGRAPLRDFVVRLRALRAAAVLRSA